MILAHTRDNAFLKQKGDCKCFLYSVLQICSSQVWKNWNNQRATLPPIEKKFYIHLNKLFITCTPCLDQPLKEKEKYGNYLCTYRLWLTYSLAHLTHTPPTTIFLTVFVLRTTDKVLERIPSAVQNLTIIYYYNSCSSIKKTFSS